LEHAITNCVSVSQVNERARDEDNATKTKTDGTATAKGELRSSGELTSSCWLWANRVSLANYLVEFTLIFDVGVALFPGCFGTVAENLLRFQ
jgi:hypothetical protein